MENYEEEEFLNPNDCEDMDLKIINFIKMINNKGGQKIPEPTKFTISTQSAMCNINNVGDIDLSKIVVYISKNIILNIILKKDVNYLIRGIVVDNLIIRFDESYLKKYKKPYIKYLGNVIDFDDNIKCLEMLESIQSLENNSLKKHGRQKNKTNENFYNSCSIITKGALDIKCVNIKLFNNGKITLTGSKNEMDGYHACCVLLKELKNDKNIFTYMKEEKDINDLQINNYKITMINSDFNTNFKIDLLKLLDILNSNDKNIFTKFNPEKYRGLIIGYYWNSEKEIQDGKCLCVKKCKGKGNGTGDGQCKKITISIFKSGSIIITGGRLVKQIDAAYSSINSILKENYFDIIKLSILDYIDNEEDEEKCNEHCANEHSANEHTSNEHSINENIIDVKKKAKIIKIKKDKIKL
jgi:TATA-box binding protein (TBP) (component of TFIID and TFIIIB)